MNRKSEPRILRSAGLNHVKIKYQMFEQGYPFVLSLEF